jgi:hypothetical protein
LDLYRLGDCAGAKRAGQIDSQTEERSLSSVEVEHLQMLGVEEAMTDGICLVEWPDRLGIKTCTLSLHVHIVFQRDRSHAHYPTLLL